MGMRTYLIRRCGTDEAGSDNFKTDDFRTREEFVRGCGFMDTPGYSAVAAIARSGNWSDRYKAAVNWCNDSGQTDIIGVTDNPNLISGILKSFKETDNAE